MITVMGVLDYDCGSWEESSVFLGMAVVYIVLFVWGIKEYKASMRATFAPSTKYIVFWYYLCTGCGLVLRILYFLSGPHLIPFPAPLYGLFSIFPGLIFATAYIFFMDFMIDSFYFNLGTLRDRLHLGIRMFLAAIWTIELAIYGGIVYQHYTHGTINWRIIHNYIGLVIFFAAIGLLVLLLVVYIRNIKKFPHSYRDKRCILLTMLIIAVVQIVYRVLYLVIGNMDGYQALQKACENTGILCLQLVFTCYLIVCDIPLIIVYILYIRKDIQHLAMSEKGLGTTPQLARKVNYPAILESWIANVVQPQYRAKDSEHSLNAHLAD